MLQGMTVKKMPPEKEKKKGRNTLMLRYKTMMDGAMVDMRPWLLRSDETNAGGLPILIFGIVIGSYIV